MRCYTSLLLTASLAFTAVIPAIADSATKPQNDLYRNVQSAVRAKKYTEAVTQAQQVLNREDLLTSDKVRFLSIAAEASMEQGADHYPAAKMFYEKIVADPSIGNMEKIAAIKGMSEAYIKTLNGQYLDKMNVTPAHTILNRALKLSDLKPTEQAAALQNIGDLYARQDNVDKALNTYQKVLKLDRSEETKRNIWQSIANVYVNTRQYGKAESIYKKYDLDVVSLYYQTGEWDKATAYLVKILDDPNAMDKEKWAAFGRLPGFYRTSGASRLNGDTRNNAVGFRKSINSIRELSSKYLPAFLQEDPNRAKILLATFKSVPVFDDAFYSRTLVNPEYLAWAAPLLLNSKLSDKDYTFVNTKYINALAALGEAQQVITESAKMQADSRLSKEVQFRVQLVNKSLTSAADIAKVANTENGLTNGDKAQEVIEAAKTVLAAGKDQAAQHLYAAYESLLQQLPRAAIKSTFVDEAPYSVEGWLSSPLLKDKQSTAKLDRPYGDNLKQLLATDATATGRDADTSAKKNTGDTEGNLHAASDTQGIHLFLDLRDSHAQEVVDGLLRGGSVEMYLAPGKDQPYYTVIPRIPTGFKGSPTSRGYGAGSFITMYPNSGWRLPSPEDGTFQTDIQRTDDGFGMSLFLSWELFYDKLPTNGTTWQFEAIRWTRSGGRSFAGSQSVHNRSSWGDIIFDGLTPQKLTAIKRAIIFKALAKYQEAKKITSPVGRWNDAELGDPHFYQSQVAPLLAHLDSYAERANKEISAAGVEDVFQNAVPGWMELEYKVAALRAQYLERHFFTK